MRVIIFVGMLVYASVAVAGQGKLLATPGVTQFEGSAGGGIVPWAMLGGYATRGQVAASAFATHITVNDFRLNVIGAGFNYHDRLEVSIARQTLEVEPLSTNIHEDVFGIKARLYGDIVYSRWPQVSIGLQHKRLRDNAIASAVGATDDRGTDFYISAARLELGAAFGYNVFWNVTARATRANQAGLLGFGGDVQDHRSINFSGAAAVFVNRHIAIGGEYRAKPDNLSAVPEDDWLDVFVAVFPAKRVNLTLAWANLGNIAGVGKQRGIYLSVTGYLQ